MHQEEGEAMNAAFEKMAYKFISKAFYSPTDSSTSNKICTEARAINKASTFDLARQRCSENAKEQSS